MKTKEELNQMKEDYEKLCKRLKELTEEELAQVTGADLSESSEAIVPILADSDLAEEATKLAEAQVKQQVEQAMLASSNQTMPNVLSLLK